MRGVTEIRDRLSWLLGDSTHPRHRAVGPPGLTLVPPPDEPTAYELNRNAATQFWRAEQDDVIGSWCVVVNRPGTPATGNPPIANFVNEQHARHIADLQNEWLDMKVRNR